MQIIILIAIYHLAKFVNTILQKLSILLQRLKNYIWVLRTLIWLLSLKMQIMAPEKKTERKLRLLGVSKWLYHCCFFHMLYSEIQNSMSVSTKCSLRPGTKCRLNTKPTGIVTQLLFRGHLPGSLNSWRNVLGRFSRNNYRNIIICLQGSDMDYFLFKQSWKCLKLWVVFNEYSRQYKITSSNWWHSCDGQCTVSELFPSRYLCYVKWLCCIFSYQKLHPHPDN